MWARDRVLADGEKGTSASVVDSELEGDFVIQQTEGERSEVKRPTNVLGVRGREGTYDGLKEDGGCTVLGNLEDTNRAEALVDLQQVKSLCEAAGLSDEERARDMTQTNRRNERGCNED